LETGGSGSEEDEGCKAAAGAGTPSVEATVAGAAAVADIAGVPAELGTVAAAAAPRADLAVREASRLSEVAAACVTERRLSSAGRRELVAAGGRADAAVAGAAAAARAAAFDFARCGSCFSVRKRKNASTCLQASSNPRAAGQLHRHSVHVRSLLGRPAGAAASEIDTSYHSVKCDERIWHACLCVAES